MLSIVGLLFLLIALLWVLSCLLPNWGWPPVITASSVIRCVIGLVVLLLVYLIVLAILGAARVGV